jgi:hypothetical protein
MQQFEGPLAIPIIHPHAVDDIGSDAFADEHLVDDDSE